MTSMKNGSDLTKFAATGLVLTMLSFGTALGAATEKNSLPTRLSGLDGSPVALAISDGGALALVFYSAECPISNEYIPTLNQTVERFSAQPFKLIGVCVDPDLTNSDVIKHSHDYALKYRVVRDPRGKLGGKLGAKTTPEVFVYDSDKKLRYHGRIDDQFAKRGKRLAVPETHEFQDAVAAILDHREVAVSYQEAVGCPLPEPAVEPAVAVPTFSNAIAGILQRNCQECHRPGQVGPFSLVTYEQARKRADDIARVVEARSMPPWKPTPGFGVKLAHDRSLPKEEIDQLLAWAESDAPEGNSAETPASPSFRDGWQLGTPDLILKPAHDFKVPASGEDIYRCFVLPSGLDKDVWVEAVEYRPGNRKVVHHVLAFIETKGEARKKDDAEAGDGYTCFGGPEVEIQGSLGGWAPGNEAARLPEGIGRFLPKKSDVIFQVHYHPTGKVETDRSEIGIYFSKKPVKKSLHAFLAANEGFVLEPGVKNQEVVAEWEFPVDAELYSVTPHMHLIGRDITMSLISPKGVEEGLVQVLDWDFNWQNSYRFATAVQAPKGSRIKVLAHYDNSKQNPRNPSHPPKLVKYGEATTDEMCIGFVSFTLKNQDLTKDSKDEFFDYLEKAIKEHDENQKKKTK